MPNNLETPRGCVESLAQTLLEFSAEAGARGDSRTCFALLAASKAALETGNVLEEQQKRIAYLENELAAHS